jgi:hypothetical protein
VWRIVFHAIQETSASLSLGVDSVVFSADAVRTMSTILMIHALGIMVVR